MVSNTFPYCIEAANRLHLAAMKARPDCVVCMMRQALDTVRRVTADPTVQLRVVQKAARMAQRATLNQTPATLSWPAYDLVARITGVSDPYKRQRKDANRIALQLESELRTLIRKSSDPMIAAVHVAVAGNIIDYGIGHKFDIEKDVRKIMKQRFAVDASRRFKKDIKRGRKVLYLADNAGEIVFDKLLIERILMTGADVTAVVKSAPIINDAVMRDAREVGLTKLVRVITSGANDIGISWDNVSKEFLTAFKAADVILGKGHGHFETCHQRPENVYFLLKVKCNMVAEELGVKLGDIVFKNYAS